MTSPDTFHFENCELDFGHFSLGGDWLLTLKTDDDGFSFTVLDAESVGVSVSRAALALAQEWVDLDTAPRPRSAKYESRIRKAYANALAGHTPTPSADRADFEHDERMNARAA